MILGLIASASETIPSIPAPPAAPSGAVYFDTTESLNALTVASQTTSDNSLITISAWITVRGATGSNIVEIGGPYGTGSEFFVDYSGALRCDLYNSAGTKSLSFGSAFSASAVSFDTLHHVFVAADTNHAAGAKLKIALVDGVNKSEQTFDSDTAFDIGVSGKRFGVPIGATGNNQIELAELWVGVGQYITDVTKFRAVDGSKVYLGANGELPTGTAPTYFFEAPASSFATNLGTGDAVTLNGTITDV